MPRARCACGAWVYRRSGATCLDWCAAAERCVGAEALARYREVSPDDDIVSRLLREGRADDAQIRDALAAIDAAARIDWDAPFAMWPFGGYSTQMTLGRKADAKGLRPRA